MREVTYRSVALRSFVATIVLFAGVTGFLVWTGISVQIILKELFDLSKDLASLLMMLAGFTIAYFMILVHWRNSAEEKEIYRMLRSLPIPLFLPKFGCPTGEWMQFLCRNKSCKGGFLAQTVIFGGHSITNGRKLSQWELDRLGQCLGGKDRLFCVECGTGHDSVNEVAQKPLNLHDILGTTS